MLINRRPLKGRNQWRSNFNEKNLGNLEAFALDIFQKGHVPIVGEWLALPWIKLAGSTRVGDRQWQEIQYPVAHRILEQCDAVLRIEGDSKGADADVKLAKERGLPIYYYWEELLLKCHSGVAGGKRSRRPGRIGDSCIGGAGLYADNDTCAVFGTGDGEILMGQLNRLLPC